MKAHLKSQQQPFIDAFLIHQRPYLEKKWIVHLFTAEHGLLPSITHQSKKKRELLQLFNPLSCQVLVRGQMSQLKQVEGSQCIAPLHGNYVFAGLYINELVYKLCQANQASPELFSLYQACIKQLSLRQDLALIVRTFEYHLQNLLGYSPNYEIIHDHDASWFSFDSERGLKPSVTASSQRYAREHLLNLAEGKLDTPEVQSISKHIFARVLKQLLGEKSLFISQMLPKSI